MPGSLTRNLRDLMLLSAERHVSSYVIQPFQEVKLTKVYHSMSRGKSGRGIVNAKRSRTRDKKTTVWTLAMTCIAIGVHHSHIYRVVVTTVADKLEAESRPHISTHCSRVRKNRLSVKVLGNGVYARIACSMHVSRQTTTILRYLFFGLLFQLLQDRTGNIMFGQGTVRFSIRALD